MKLKYYLRGIGIGVIVATLIMTISSVIHNNNLSDEMIIKEAQKLGMIMPENTEDKDSLWEKKEDTEVSTENTVNTENVQSTENVQNTEDVQNTENVQNTNNTQNTEDTHVLEDAELVEITIVDTDGARHVSEKLFAAGVITDAKDFRQYLSENGYAYTIRSGRFKIPKGSTYEQICDIIIRK